MSQQQEPPVIASTRVTRRSSAQSRMIAGSVNTNNGAPIPIASSRPTVHSSASIPIRIAAVNRPTAQPAPYNSTIQIPVVSSRLSSSNHSNSTSNTNASTSSIPAQNVNNIIPLASVTVVPQTGNKSDVAASSSYSTQTTPTIATIPASLNSIPETTASFVPNNNRGGIDLSKLRQRDFDETYLKEQNFPEGLIDILRENHDMVLKRYWIVDNSGSMLKDDSRRILTSAPKKQAQPSVDGRTAMMQTQHSSNLSSSSQQSIRSKFGFLKCTRWRELQQCVMTHAETAAQVGFNSHFKLLNKPGFGSTINQFTVANKQIKETDNKDKILEQEIAKARKVIMDTEPYGSSPLTKALRDIREELQDLSSYLHDNDKRVFVIIATDGLPTKNGKTSPQATREFMTSLRALELYPVWIIIRLCSSDDETLQFYRSLDDQLERSVDVITTFADELDYCKQYNRWLNYPFGIQFCREFGTHIRIFDILNERLLTMDEMIKMCEYLFGSDTIRNLPDPHDDWLGFSSGLETVLEGTQAEWNPVTNRLEKWISIGMLNKLYGTSQNGTTRIESFGHEQENNMRQVQQQGNTASTNCSCVVS